MRKLVVLGVFVAVVGAAAFAAPALAQRRPAVLALEAAAGARLGVTVRDLREGDPDAAAAGGTGVVIERVQEGTPAAQAGFMSGDIVVEFDGERIRSAAQFVRVVRETPPGREVMATVVRGGARQQLEVTPTARAAFGALPDEVFRQFERSLRVLPRDFDFDFDVERFGVLAGGALGARVATLTPQLAEYFGVENGVLVESVESGSRAEQAGLRAGDVITAVGGESVESVGDVSRELRRAGRNAAVDLRVTRDRKELTITVPAGARPAPASTGGGISV